MRRTDRNLVCLALATLVGCGADGSVVGGRCADGFEQVGQRCTPLLAEPADAGSVPVDGPPWDASADGEGAADADPGDASLSMDGGVAEGGDVDAIADAGDGGPVCAPFETLCNGECVDITTDPTNCGTCGKVCPSNLCVAGQCSGSASGHVVFVGHDYSQLPAKASSQARVLTNAVLLPLSNPVRVLSYEHHASSVAVANATSLVQGAAATLGRSVAFTPTMVDGAIPATLDIQTYDVLLVHDQRNAPPGALAALGAAWAASGRLASFLSAGGVIVLLDGGQGTGDMPTLSTEAGLLSVTAHAPATGALAVLAPNDVVGAGVVSPYLPLPHSVSLTTEPSGPWITYVVAKNGAPVVVHKVVP
jgi:hypothetical protein